MGCQKCTDKPRVDSDGGGATNANVSGRVPIGPPCGRLLNQIDVLALRILSCAEKEHGRGGAEVPSLAVRLYMSASIPLIETRQFKLSHDAVQHSKGYHPAHDLVGTN